MKVKELINPKIELWYRSWVHSLRSTQMVRLPPVDSSLRPNLKGPTILKIQATTRKSITKQVSFLRNLKKIRPWEWSRSLAPTWQARSLKDTSILQLSQYPCHNKNRRICLIKIYRNKLHLVFSDHWVQEMKVLQSIWLAVSI